MKRPGLRLSRPLYESLPWLYVLGGILALAASYRHQDNGLLSVLVAIFGVFTLLGGIVVLLRRRDFRASSSEYAERESLLSPPRED